MQVAVGFASDDGSALSDWQARMQDLKTTEEGTCEEYSGQHPTQMTAGEFLAILRETGAIGMWKDRTDIKDSSEFARELRKRAQTRQAE